MHYLQLDLHLLLFTLGLGTCYLKNGCLSWWTYSLDTFGNLTWRNINLEDLVGGSTGQCCRSWAVVFMFWLFELYHCSCNQGDKARVIQTLLFVAGINTLLQALFGTRLPAVVGGSYAYVVPIAYIIRDTSLQRITDGHEVSSSIFPLFIVCTLLGSMSKIAVDQLFMPLAFGNAEN